MKGYKARAYPTLRECLDIARVDIGIHLPEVLGISKSSVGLSINGKRDWRQSEMFKLMETIHKPYNLMHVIFSEEERQGIYNKTNRMRVLDAEIEGEKKEDEDKQ